IYSDGRNGEISGLADEAFYAVLGKDSFIQGRRAERVRPIYLKRIFDVVVGRRELRNYVWPSIVKWGTEVAAVDAVVLELLIDEYEILRAVTEVARIEDSVVDHGSRARQAECCGCSAGTRKDVARELGDATGSRAAGNVGVQDLRAERVGKRAGSKGRKR